MANHRLSIEQKFRLEAVFREIDACIDIEMLRALTKQIITAEESEMAFVRHALALIRKEMEEEAVRNFRPGWTQSPVDA